MRSRLGLAAVIALAAACSSWTPPPPPPGQPSPPPPDTVRKAGGGIDEAGAPSFPELANDVLDEWQAEDPGFARDLGLHAYDGKVQDFSAAAIKRRLARLHEVLRALDRVDETKLSADETLDRAILKGRAEQTLFRGEDLDEWEKNPRYYEDLFGVNAYLDRDYAPIEERAKKLVEHEKAALAQIPNVLANLSGPMSKPLVETSIKVFKGYAEYLRGDVVKLVGKVGTPAFQRELAETNRDFAKAADAIVDRLKTKELPRGDDSHVLGAARYAKLLRVQEGLTIPLADFEKMGEENLALNKRAYDELRKKTTMTQPPVSKLLDEAAKLTERARVFVVDKKIATLPTDAHAVVKETPPFMRWNSAFLNPPGPYEDKATTAFYYITLPDPKWSKKEQSDYVPPFGILMSTTVHEVYPGHFLQGQWIKKAPTRVEKSIASYSFVEGWAHYGEQVMVEEGFEANDPQNKLGQLSDALLRNCRFVVSVALHTEGMTLDQAEKRFMNDCYQDKATAREQAIRGAFDPGYFAYTLGKIQILALREEAKKRLGAKFDLRKFNDEVLSHGSPAIPLIHDRVLADLDAAK